MTHEIIETEKCIIKVHDNDILEYSIKEGVTLNALDIMIGKKEVLQRFPGVKFYVLAGGVEFFSMTSEAREICATKEYSDNTFAVAFYTSNVSIRLLGELYNKINKPAVPTKVFYSRENAKEWLIEQRLKQVQ